jgi:hypothetical protein
LGIPWEVAGSKRGGTFMAFPLGSEVHINEHREHLTFLLLAPKLSGLTEKLVLQAGHWIIIYNSFLKN